MRLGLGLALIGGAAIVALNVNTDPPAVITPLECRAITNTLGEAYDMGNDVVRLANDQWCVL